MASTKVNTSALYSELIRAGDNGEFDKALKVVNKLLQENPKDTQLLQCQAVCHIHLSEFEEGLEVLEKNFPGECHFEKAYCMYRLNKIQEALSLLKSVPNPPWKVKELIAQVLYRLELYEESFESYVELIKNSDDDYEEERETNLSAVVAYMSKSKKKDLKLPQLREHTYELCYNAACVLISQAEYSKAIEKLKVAEELCKKTLEENDVPEEEIEAELGIIRVQLGYAHQMQNKHDRALKIYNQVLKKKPSDTAIVAVASNNIITINKDQNVFDSKKKIKIITAENLDSKLTTEQRQAIAINHCLLLLHTNQMEQCKKQVQQLSKNYPLTAANAALLQAAVHCKEKKVQKAVDVLKDYAVSHPELSVSLSFTLAQLLLMQGHINEACMTLRSMGEISYSPGVLSALVTLYLYVEDKDSAINVLNEAIAWYKKTNATSPALSTIIRETSKMELKNGRPKEAAKLLEELRKMNPNDLKSLAQLISAYSQFDSKKAKEVSLALPLPSDTPVNIDIDSLESINWTMGAKYIKKGAKSEPSVAMKSGGSTDAVVQKKKKKRKKGKLPKSYDPSVDPDPERWLPKRERSAYKKKKDKRTAGIGKGTQGAIASSEDSTKNITVPSPITGPTSSPNVQGPRQQKVIQKKKKKGRW